MLKAMLIDDEKWIIKSLKSSIDWFALGYEIIGEASNGLEGYDKIMSLRPDIVFTDIRMPGMDGIELMRMIYESNLDVHFVIASGYKEFELAKKAMKYGALDYCLKPFDEREITSILEQFGKKKNELKAAEQTELMSLVHEGDACSQPPPLSGGGSRNTTYLKIIDYIDIHFKEELSLQCISEKLGLNLSYISQLFRKESSYTFLQYLTQKRMACAIGLLRSTSMPIQDIAEHVGYSDYFHFAKLFKKCTGVTATQYREQAGILK